MRNKYGGWGNRKPHAVLGGIDPILQGGEDAQLTARKVHMYSRYFDGYWVFYEGVVQGSKHEYIYDRWWKIANDAIVHEKDTVLFDLRRELPHLAEQWLDNLNATLP